jgi:siroheme synthase (precorrin-2 oxidase/ferrochelatase)
MQKAEKLVRKQFLITPTQAKKIGSIAKRQKTSAAEMVRKAIDAFNPDALAEMAETELLELVRVRVKDAIKDTKKTRERLSSALNRLEAKEG